jgi:hypothetical protein
MVFSGSYADPGPYKESHPIEKDANKLMHVARQKLKG